MEFKQNIYRKRVMKRRNREGDQIPERCQGVMYYTIEGKRFLCVLYITGLLIGTIFINMSLKMHFFRLSDFLGFAEYVKTLDGLDTRAFFSYVCLVRGRQLLLFFFCLFLFSPYVVYCILDFVVSIVLGMFLSVLVAKYGMLGMVRGVVFLTPHFFFYGVMLILIYIYLFQKTPFSGMYRISTIKNSIVFSNKRFLENKIIVVLFCFLLFGMGCYAEAYMNPLIVRWIFH